MRSNGKVPPPSDGKRLAIYCRKSTVSEGDGRGRSVNEQYQQCVLAANALGFEVTERLTFLEKDGNKGEWFWDDREVAHPGPHRPELTRLMDAVEGGEVDAVMVWRTDRLYRDDLVSGFLLRRLRALACRLYSRTQDLHIHTASGFQAASTQACADRAYKDKISEDVIRSHEMNAQNGMLIRDGSALGFRSAGKGTGRVVPVPDELDTVRMIFKLYTQGEDGCAPLSANAVAQRLMALGRRTAVGARGHKTKYPDRVCVNAVTRILRNASYCGLIELNGELYPTRLFDVPAPDGSGQVRPVVEVEIYEQARHRLESGDRFERDSRAKLLNGVVLCPCCGRKMYTDPIRPGRRQSLYCRHRGGRFRTCLDGNYRSLLVETLEGWCREHLAPLLAAELTAIKALRKGDEAGVELAASERRLAEMLRFEGERLSELVLSLDAQQVSAVGRKLKADREVVERRIAELRATTRRESEERRDPFDLLATDEGLLRLALQRAVRWISVCDKGIVVLTRSGAYIGAYLARGDKRNTGGHRPPKILPPTVEATRECRRWIEDSDSFLSGARFVKGRWGRTPPDEELLPDYIEGGAE